MSKGTVLITDSLFIFKEHEDKIRAAGYEIERLDVPKASDDQLITALKGKVGYILGGLEEVSARIIDSTDSLRVIALAGTDWKKYIPAHQEANAKGIAITYCPTYAMDSVAEYSLLLTLSMLSNVFESGSTGSAKYFIRDSIFDKKIGIIGLGRIGTRMAQMLKGIGVADVQYYSRSRKPDAEKELGIAFTDLDSLLGTSDVVTLHVGQETGDNFIGVRELGLMKDGAVLVNTAYERALDLTAAHVAVTSSRLRIAHDGPVGSEFKDISPRYWFNSNTHAGYSTHRSLKIASDSATASLLNILESGGDQFKVN